MSSSHTGSAMLPHRSVANIRSPPSQQPAGTGPSTPMHRPISSTFGSPSSLRAEEETVIVELGTRKVRVGFAGDAAPRGTVWFSPEHHRRAGDFRAWLPDYRPDWRTRASGEKWGRDHELWRADIRGLDLGLVGDKLERALREAFTKWVPPTPDSTLRNRATTGPH